LTISSQATQNQEEKTDNPDPVFKMFIVMVHTFNPSTQEVETGGSQDLGQPGLPSEILSQKKK
jgi:hypothetical protein